MTRRDDDDDLRFGDVDGEWGSDSGEANIEGLPWPIPLVVYLIILVVMLYVLAYLIDVLWLPLPFV